MPPSESEALAPVAQALAHAARLLPRAPTLAAELARAVLAAVPGHPEAEYILGGALRRQGDAPAARVVLENLAAAQPRSAHTHYELALTLAAPALSPPCGAARHSRRDSPMPGAAWATCSCCKATRRARMPPMRAISAPR
jgi:hypothetical protein